MSRKFKTGKKNRTSYIYYAADGLRVVLNPGENGITGAEISLLHQLDDAEYDNNRCNESGQLRFSMLVSEDGKDMSDRRKEMADPRPGIPELMMRAESFDRLHSAIGTLQPRQRELLEAVFFQQRKITDIAAEQGVSHVAVVRRLNRIYKKLKNFLK